MGTRLAAKVFPCPQPVPEEEASGDIGARMERNTARAWLRSGILASIGEQRGLAHDIDALAVLMTHHPFFGVRTSFRVALKNSKSGEVASYASGIASCHQLLPAFGQDQVLDVTL